jgi:hypothetical protein
LQHNDQQKLRMCILKKFTFDAKKEKRNFFAANSKANNSEHSSKADFKRVSKARKNKQTKQRTAKLPLNAHNFCSCSKTTLRYFIFSNCRPLFSCLSFRLWPEFRINYARAAPAVTPARSPMTGGQSAERCQAFLLRATGTRPGPDTCQATPSAGQARPYRTFVGGPRRPSRFPRAHWPSVARHAVGDTRHPSQ